MINKSQKKTKKEKRPKLTAVGIMTETKNRLNAYISTINSQLPGSMRLVSSYEVSIAINEYLDKKGAPK